MFWVINILRNLNVIAGVLEGYWVMFFGLLLFILWFLIIIFGMVIMVRFCLLYNKYGKRFLKMFIWIIGKMYLSDICDNDELSLCLGEVLLI